MKHSQGAMEGASSLRTLVGNPSGPHTFLGFNCLSCLSTPWTEILRSEMELYCEFPLNGAGNFS